MNKHQAPEHIATTQLASVTGGSQNGFVYTQMFENQRELEKRAKAATASKR